MGGGRLIYYAIFGYEITRKCVFGNANINPIFHDHISVTGNLKAVNQSPTAVLEIELLDKNLVFDLEAVLTFIDQANVQIWGPLDATNLTDALSEAASERIDYRRKSRGKFIRSDAFEPSMRCEVSTKLMNRMRFGSDDTTRAFSRLLHATSFGLANNVSEYVDLSYYLYFSNLEALARAHYDDFSTKNVAQVLNRFFNDLDFSLVQQDDTNLLNSCHTYSTLRNSLFHKGQVVAAYNISSGIIELKLTDFSFHFKTLVHLCILKFAGFDRPNLNWSCWQNGMPL